MKRKTNLNARRNKTTKSGKDRINITEFKKSRGLVTNTVVDNNKKENEVNQKGQRIKGEQKRKSA